MCSVASALGGPVSENGRALSTDRCNSAAEHLGWFHPSQRLSRASVELPGHRGEIGACVGAKVRTSREVLTKQTIGVLAAATLPRAVRVAEVDIDVGVDGETDVLGHLFPLVPRQRAPKVRGELGKLPGQRTPHVLSGASVGQVHQHKIAAPAFDHSPDRRASTLSDDQVALPMARNGAVGGLGGTVADHDHVLQSTGT